MLSVRGIGRLGLVIATVMALSSVAQAGRKFRVTISTDPVGAELYLNDDESDSLGVTPIKTKLESGVYTLIVKKDGYQTEYEQFRVKKRGNNKITIPLDRLEPGKISVAAPKTLGNRLDGAEVKVDGESVGTVPLTHTVSAGAHAVEITKDGFEAYEEYIEVEGGATLKITADLTPIGGENKDPFGGGETRVENKVAKKASSRSGAPPPMVVLGAGLELGGRLFRYENGDSCDLCRTYDANGVPRFRIRGELYPLVVLDNPALDGFGVTGSFGRAAPLTSQTSDGVNVDTTWTDFDVGVRYQYLATRDLMVGAGVGFGGEEFTFDEGSALFEEVPVVNYRFVRLSADARVRVHEYVSAFGGAQFMLVSDVGTLGDRFADNKAYGFGLRAGGLGHLVQGFDARIEGVYNQFAHSYTPSMDYNASGGKDHYWAVMFGGAYTY